MLAIIQLLTLPILFLNFFGGIVAAIWLAVLGKWAIIFQAFAFAVFGHWIISLALMPGIGISALALHFQDRSKPLSHLIGIASILYTSAIMCAWCIIIFKFFTLKANSSNLIPIMLASYSAALGPWQFLASKEQNSYSNFTTMLAQFGYIIMMILSYAYKEYIISPFFIAIAIGILANIIIAYLIDRYSA